MAYLRKLPSGKWRAEIELHGARKSASFPTKTEAREWAAQQEADLIAGRAGQFPAKTWGDAVTRYMAEVTPTKDTAANEVKRLNAFLRDFPGLAARQLTEVAPDHVIEWLRARLAAVTPATVKREANTLRHVHSTAAKVWRWCPLETPWSFVKLPGEQPPRDRRVGWREVRRICRRLGYVSGKAPHTLSCEVAHAFLVALRTAMRAGEIIGLTRGAVNLETRVIRLDEHKTKRYTGRARFVPFTVQARRLLAVLAGQGRESLFTVSDTSREALFRKAVKQCGIVGLRFHDSRGEALTLLARRVDVLTLQRISGHSDINTLVNHYYRESPEQVAARL